MRRKILLALGILVGIGLLGTASAHALNAQSGDTLSVSKGEVIDASIYRAGKNITIAGVVKGDVFCAGQKIEVSGTVEGDVICAGQDVRVSGKVLGDVRLAGQNVTVTGEVTGSLSAAGQSVALENSAKIGRDVSIAGQTTHLAGKIGRDGAVAGQALTFNGPVARDLSASGEDITLANNAAIGGNLTYTSNNIANIDRQATIAGQTEHKTPPPKKTSPADRATQFMGPINWIISMVVVGGLFLLVLPRWFKGATSVMRQKAVATVGLGFAGLILTPILAIVLLISILGIPVGVALLILWFVAIFTAFTFTAYSGGTWLLTKLPWMEHGKEFAALLLGTLLLVLFMSLPYLGPWIGFMALIWGLGGIYYAIGRSVRAQRTPVKKSKIS